LAERRGAEPIHITIPEPASYDNVLSTYTAALDKHPNVRLVLLTHVSNKTGLVIPSAALTTLARSRGADTIVDAAHAIGQIDLGIPDLGADFVGFNLHKWIGAPLGVAAFYIKKSRLADIDRMMGEQGETIDSRIHTGTTNFAAFLTIPAALDFHEAIGRAHKAARLRYLRDRWVQTVRELPHVQVLTPDDPRMSAGITSFRLRGQMVPTTDHERVVETLLTRHGIFTRRSTGVDGGDCVRVTPSLYTKSADVDRLARALRELV
jgi:isopenicillin-N epimerase